MTSNPTHHTPSTPSIPSAQKGENVYNQPAPFWETYIQGRPSIPDSFFTKIFTYHATHSPTPSFTTAHEAGAGIGIHSPRLAARFPHVLISDIIPSNIEIARTRLQSEGCYTFKTSSLEDTIDLPTESLDLVFASTMMHFTDTEKAVRAIHHQLKPGGTFAAGLYGTYALHEPRAQAIWQRLVLAICDNIIANYGLDDRSKSILQNEAAGLDSVGLPPDLFHPAQRFEYNFPTRSTLRDMILPKEYGLEPVERVGERDSVTRGLWDEGWFSKEGMQGLRGIARTWPHDETNKEIVGLWEELEGEIGEREAQGGWLVSLLLATKK